MYLKVSYQIWTNETVVKTLKLVAHVVIASFSYNVFESRHHVIDKALMNSLVHSRLSFLCSLNIQNLHERLYGNALEEYREVNHANCRCNKQRLKWHVFWVNQQNKSESNCPSQATIWHDKLINARQLVDPEFVCHESENYHTCEQIKCYR